MGRRPKQPNGLLAELLDESDLSNKGFARRVVERGRAIGLQLSYDHTSVSRWLSGEQPNAPGPELIAEIFTEMIGRRVTVAECGMVGSGEPIDVGLEFPLSWYEGVESVTALWRSDVERRRFLVGASYAVAVYPAASMRWLTLPGPEHPINKGRKHIGHNDVEAVRTMTSAFRDLDNKVGGGRVRGTVAQYLHSSVAPLLHGNYAERVGRQLFGAAAELTRLAGWMAYDEEQHGLAQRYLIQALGLARTAGDTALGAEILAAMSHQATYVGRAGDAVDLARAARIAAHNANLAALESECYLAEAHGHAARGDAAATGKALNAANRAFDRSDLESPDWLGYFDQAYIAAKTAHCYRELSDHGISDQGGTAKYAELSLEMSDGYQRGKAFNLCVLASAHAKNEPLEAIRVGGQAIEIVVGLSSKRSLAYLRDLRHRLEVHTGIPDVAEFRRRVSEITTHPA